ncbi:hypothetical protein D2A34_12275 [Clostridium chromiireducens]|uniref:Uncharacterized protein n=1 Tax=Clostridium chromiireducens TaxID=225345 RepID=A0A399ILI4_9CLOT|nr:hypothetical protein [Clostridium chromiireducens]RII33958.1 hypothetical protein D2A34_12275 [Clostridium chromiireducens]
MDNEKEKYNKNESKKICNEQNFVTDDFCNIECDYFLNEEETVEHWDEEENKKNDNCSQENEPKIYASCNLKVDFDTKNKMLYLIPGKSQFFTVDVSKCCGDVTIRYNGCSSNNGIRGNLAVYKIVQAGIITETYSKLDPKKKDILHFTATDECSHETYDFVAIFSCNLCRCYC